MTCRTATDRRRAELARIHLAKRDLGLDDDTYRDLLWTLARVRSAADLDAAGRAAVLDHFKALGWRGRRRGRPVPAAERTPLLSKIRALLGERQDAYAEGILKRMYGNAAPARLEWASEEQLRKVVAALEYDRRRHADD